MKKQNPNRKYLNKVKTSPPPDTRTEQPRNITGGKIRISIYDDHDSVRESYKRWLLNSGFDVVSDGNKLDPIKNDIEKYKPDVILMDIDFPGKPNEGIKVCKNILKSYPDVKIIFITHYNEPDIIISALKAGAHAYFSKSDALKFLKEAIEKTLSNYIYISPTALRSLVNSLTHLTPQKITPLITSELTPKEINLTDEEKLILKYIAQGLSNKEIAKLRLTNEKRIKNIVSNILIKMSAKNRAHAVAKAIIYHIISPDEIISSFT